MGVTMTRAMFLRNGLCLIVVLGISGCVASTKRYPSLERWPAERMSAAPAPAPPAASTAPNAEIAAHVAALVDQARTSRAGFTAKQGPAERALVGAGAAGSDSWGRASIALAELEQMQAPAIQALAELDQLEVDNRTRNAGAEDADTAVIVTARDEAAAIADEQAAVLSRLRAKLG
jgi:hypothetical protein